jgi:uncharacterized protein with ParB-like and HNH nuclease domain
MSSRAGIEIDREGIGHAISDNTLAVPIYQRSYMWEEEQVRQLFEDLAGAMASDNADYFLGSIVVAKNPQGIPEVVDGQQRLATVTILIAAIRDYFAQHGDDQAANEFERQYLLSRDMRTREILPKLRLNEASAVEPRWEEPGVRVVRREVPAAVRRTGRWRRAAPTDQS